MKLRRRIARVIGLCVPEPEPWTGPVVRRDPASVRQQSVQLTWTCVNPHCRQWTMNGAYLTGRCNFCQTARPQVGALSSDR